MEDLLLLLGYWLIVSIVLPVLYVIWFTRDVQQPPKEGE